MQTDARVVLNSIPSLLRALRRRHTAVDIGKKSLQRARVVPSRRLTHGQAQMWRTTNTRRAPGEGEINWEKREE